MIAKPLDERAGLNRLRFLCVEMRTRMMEESDRTKLGAITGLIEAESLAKALGFHAGPIVQSNQFAPGGTRYGYLLNDPVDNSIGMMIGTGGYLKKGMPGHPEIKDPWQTMDRSHSRAEAIKYLIRWERAIDAKLGEMAAVYITTAEASERAGCDKVTITRRCNQGKIPGAIAPSHPSNTTGGWKIPESSVPIAKPAKAAKPKPKLATAAMWVCIGCEHEITSKAKPDKCPKCQKHTFTRKSLKSPAV